jgi:hypothetical protein
VRVLSVGGSVGLAFDHSRQNAAEFAHAEETVAAGIAAVGGKPEPALQKNEAATLHSLAGDMLDIKITAAGAVREAFQDRGHSPSLKSPIATVAAPRAQSSPTEQEVKYPVAVRTKTIVTATLGTKHVCSECVAQNTENPVHGQDGENTESAKRSKFLRGCAVGAAVFRWELGAQPSGMDIAALLGDNFAHSMRQAPRPRRLNEFDPEYAR